MAARDQEALDGIPIEIRSVVNALETILRQLTLKMPKSDSDRVIELLSDRIRAVPVRSEVAGSHEADIAREESLRAREEISAQTWLELNAFLINLQEANENLVLANLRSQTMAAEMGGLYEEATTAIKAKDEFFEMISHELRAPLTSISGWAYLLAKDPDPAMISEAALSIARSAALQAKLVNDLLDMSRIRTGKFVLSREEVDLWTIASEAATAMRPLAVAKGVVLKLSAQQLAVLEGDAARLRQVVDNLLSNAVKFTPPGGIIDLRLTQEDTEVALEISDTGEGIAKDFLPNVFQLHAQADTARHGGLGLGLALVKHIVELHGGTVEAHSEGEGTGAKFTIRMPAAKLDEP